MDDMMKDILRKEGRRPPPRQKAKEFDLKAFVKQPTKFK